MNNSLNHFWSSSDELQFLDNAKKIIDINHLLIKIDNEYYVYCPKNIKTDLTTPQGRNSLIGKYTESWCRQLLNPIARKYNLYAVNNVICPEIGLTNGTGADLAFCTTDENKQPAENIKLIFEIKMSLTNNYRYNKYSDNFELLGDMSSHKATPSLLRSDSMLKAIGKSINIRVDSKQGKNIPIIIIGNSPISKNYTAKVDALYQSGVIQKFISVNPNINKTKYVFNSPKSGFVTTENYADLENIISPLINNKMQYFSAMLDNDTLAKYIQISNNEESSELKAKKFLSLLSGENNE